LLKVTSEVIESRFDCIERKSEAILDGGRSATIAADWGITAHHPSARLAVEARF
jgi:hypothetical protein